MKPPKYVVIMYDGINYNAIVGSSDKQPEFRKDVVGLYVFRLIPTRAGIKYRAVRAKTLKGETLVKAHGINKVTLPTRKQRRKK